MLNKYYAPNNEVHLTIRVYGMVYKHKLSEYTIKLVHR